MDQAREYFQDYYFKKTVTVITDVYSAVMLQLYISFRIVCQPCRDIQYIVSVIVALGLAFTTA